MTQAVYFNLDATLTENDIDYEAVYQHAIKEAGLTALQDAYEDYTEAFFNYFQNGWAYPRRQAISDIMDAHDIADTGQSDRFAEAWEDEEASRTTFLPDAADTLTALSDQYHIGVLTNGTGRLQRMKLEEAGLLDMVDTVVVSSEVGYVKPHKEIFTIAQKAADADDALIVSHDVRRDILPAKRAGFKTVWLTDSTKDLPQNVDELVDQTTDRIAAIPDTVNSMAGAAEH